MKKSIFAMLILVVVLSTSAFAATFTDVSEDQWARKAITRWADEGVITGYPDGTYLPNNFITRAEYAQILVKIFQPEKKADLSNYKDVVESSWYYDSMAKVLGMKAMEETSKTTVRPNAVVTRQEAVVTLNAILKLKVESKNDAAIEKFIDHEEIADSAENDVLAFAEREYVIGYPDESFRPTGTITRAEIATVLDRAIATIIEAEGEYDLSAYKGSTVIVKANNVSVKNTDGVNIVFLNDKVKSSLKGLTNKEKEACVVINPTESTSKSTGRSSGGSSSSSSTKTAVIEVKTVSNASGDYYTVTRNGVDVAVGRKLSIKVDGKYVVTSKTVESGDSILGYMLDVANAMDTEKIFNTLDRDEYLTDADVILWGTETAKELLTDTEVKVRVLAKTDAEHKVYSVYKAMLEEGFDAETIKAKALEIFEAAYKDSANTDVTFEKALARMNEFKA